MHINEYRQLILALLRHNLRMLPIYTPFLLRRNTGDV